MKKLFIAVAFCAAMLGSYIVGRKSQARVYEDACHMSDLIRCYMDHLESDSLIQDYGCFDELCGIFLYDDCIADPPVKLDNYGWCY